MELFLYGVLSVVFFGILYFVIKEAVRNGILEANLDKRNMERRADGEPRMSLITCPNCGNRHEIDDPQCPVCRYKPAQKA